MAKPRRRQTSVTGAPKRTEQTTAGRAWFFEWAAKGIIGGFCGLLVTLGIQNASTVRERQTVAKLLLPEVEHNQSVLRSFQTRTVVDEVKDDNKPLNFQREVYEQLLPRMGVMPSEIVRGVFALYVEITTVDLMAARVQLTRDVIRKEFGDAAGDDFVSLPNSAKRMMLFQAQLNRADRINLKAQEKVRELYARLGIVGPLQSSGSPQLSLNDRLRLEAAPRWWLNWLE